MRLISLYLIKWNKSSEAFLFLVPNQNKCFYGALAARLLGNELYDGKLHTQKNNKKKKQQQKQKQQQQQKKKKKKTATNNLLYQ